ncbi:ABC transporter permease [Marinobacter xestospongiae]|uniref:ABC transporter permease n=1 Tax=Marinobacter xestospongiae TaxID=994319 RepID=A0ABU3VXI0_9GAMM|nr:ABC transporter permease [Marinobacter xestospongiae]MDV2078979.1 ABC transporter permease [Marinobacter xestospongiae]
MSFGLLTAVPKAGGHAQIPELLRGFATRLAVFSLLLALTFALPRLLPGDPVELLHSSDLMRELTAAEEQRLYRSMGLEGSWLDQFGGYMAAVLQGNLGYSIQHGAAVSQLLAHALPWTGLLILGAMPIALLIGVTAGIEAGRCPHGPFDLIATGLMTCLSSVPPFAWAILLVLVFGVMWPILPPAGAQSVVPPHGAVQRVVDIAWHAVLPMLSLALHEVARFYFLCRGEAVGLSSRPFIVNARARGLGGLRERIHYYGRNLLPAVLARLSDSVTGLVGTVVFVEIVFSYPGLGGLIYDAIVDRDYVLLQGAVLWLAAFVLLMNWLLDTVVSALARRG